MYQTQLRIYISDAFIDPFNSRFKKCNRRTSIMFIFGLKKQFWVSFPEHNAIYSTGMIEGSNIIEICNVSHPTLIEQLFGSKLNTNCVTYTSTLKMV